MSKITTCTCGAKIRNKPYAPGKVGIAIILKFELSGVPHFCPDEKQPRGNCLKAMED